MSNISFSLLIHAHQPFGNFQNVMEDAYSSCYLPFIEMLARHPAIRISLHYSGCLLEWIEEHHPDFFGRLEAMVEGQQVELVGGGFYEPILAVIPPEDRQAQLCLMSAFLKERWGVEPAGAWLAERVWEPQLPAALAGAGIQYTLVDDMHFLAAGLDQDQCFGYYVTEELGQAIKIVPGLKSLRYLIPFRPVEQCIAFLRESAEKHSGGLAAMGDDCEKFGVWPGTYKHCYEGGWLEEFFRALESHSDWLRLMPLGEYLVSRPPLGRVYLPTASYTELMEWALPTPARLTLERAESQSEKLGEFARFLRGGYWRNFLSKYPEANHLHKRVLQVSSRLRAERGSSPRRVEATSGARHKRSPAAAGWDEAYRHLLRAQGNDCYWHGIFGGVYAPHLRSVAWRELLQAEASLAVRGAKHAPEVFDLDSDGEEEIFLASKHAALVWKPSDGGTLAEFSFYPAAMNIVNSMTRRPEAYHDKLKPEARARADAGLPSIHEQGHALGERLLRLLRYDHYPRHSFRCYLFPKGKTVEDFVALELGELVDPAKGAWSVADAGAHSVHFVWKGQEQRGLELAKVFSWAENSKEFALTCRLGIHNHSKQALEGALGVELIVNLLAANSPDRYWLLSGSRQEPLAWCGETASPDWIGAVDEWDRLQVEISASGAARLWIAPTWTVSQSESGFDAVYQGSGVMPVWDANVPAGAGRDLEITLRLSRLP